MRTFEESYLEIWRPDGLCFTFEGFPALTTSDNGMAVRVTLVTRREDVERVLDVGHGWGGGREDGEDGGTGGRMLYTFSGGGDRCTYQAEPRVFYVSG